MTSCAIEFQLSTSLTSGQNGGSKNSIWPPKFTFFANLAKISNKMSYLIDFDLLITNICTISTFEA